MKITLGSSRWTVTLNIPMGLMMALKIFRHCTMTGKKGSLAQGLQLTQRLPNVIEHKLLVVRGEFNKKTSELKDRTGQYYSMG